MFHDDEFNRIFEQMSSSFVNLDDVFEMLKNAGTISGPVFYGYTMTTGPDGKPVVQEYGNVKPDMLPTENKREPLIDTLVDEKEMTLKIIAESIEATCYGINKRCSWRNSWANRARNLHNFHS